MSCEILVRSLVLGATSPVEIPPPVKFVFETEVITVRELIARSVEAQLRSLHAHQAHAEAILARQYLSREDIQTLAQEGAVRVPGNGGQAPDLDREIRKACHGFTHNRFFIQVNGLQPESLDDKILLTAHTQVMFIRLMPLIGG